MPNDQVGKGAGKLSPPSWVAKVAEKHRSTVTTDLADVLLPSEVALGVFLVLLTRVWLLSSVGTRQDDTTNRLAGETEKWRFSYRISTGKLKTKLTMVSTTLPHSRRFSFIKVIDNSFYYRKTSPRYIEHVLTQGLIREKKNDLSSAGPVTYLFRKSYSPPYSVCLSVGLISWLYSVSWLNFLIAFYVLVLFLFVLVIPTCDRLCCQLSGQLLSARKNI